MPLILNAANEVAVAAFLENSLRFQDIPTVIQDTMEVHTPRLLEGIGDALETDRRVREQAARFVRTRAC